MHFRTIQQGNQIFFVPFLSFMACLSVPYFSYLPGKLHSFREKNHLALNMRFCFFCNLIWKDSPSTKISARFLSQLYKSIHKVLRIFYDFKQILIFSTSLQILLEAPYMKFRKPLSSGSRVIPNWRRDGHSTKLIVFPLNLKYSSFSASALRICNMHILHLPDSYIYLKA